MLEALSGTGAVALAAAGIAAAIVIAYLLKKPAFTLATQLWLLLGLGFFPLLTAGFGNAAGFHATKSVEFCSSCHVMLAHSGDALDLDSQSLAARHSRNAAFGEESCYTCHADYGMFGAVFTKLNGMRHVYHYLTEYRSIPLAEALTEIHIYQPFPNTNCMQCHSTTTRLWLDVNDHVSALDDVRSGKLSCASEGCHGYAHPFTKAARAVSAHKEGF
jgi:cytochrome c-type protein NapC